MGMTRYFSITILEPRSKDYEQSKDKPMGMDTHSVFRGGYSVFHSEHCLHDNVQADGHVECRPCSLYQPAFSSLGVQAFLEPVRGHHPHKEMVGRVHAAPDDCRSRGLGTDSSVSFCRDHCVRGDASVHVRRDSGSVLDNRLRFCNP